MRRYRGAGKPPGPTLSPPPYSKTSTRSQAGSTRNSTGGSIPRQAMSGFTTPVSDNELFMMRGLATASAPFLDPRTKKPMIPPAGRTVPKLKMADLTSSLAPLVENHVGQQQKSPLSVTDKRIAEALKEVTSTKDMLESFDDAIMAPDMRAINSRVAQLRKGIGPPSHAGKLSSSRLGNASVTRTKLVPSESRKLNAAKVSPKNEEQNIRRLMGQLKEKYLDDMESQLGLAIERRPKAFQHGDSLTGDNAQSNGDPGLEVGIPRPSTNAREISSRIDQVVREWATESQKFSTVMKVPPSPAKQQQSQGGMNKINNSTVAKPKVENDINGNIIDNKKQGNNNNAQASSVAPAKNKNLAKISTAFRKSLDPISKRDVRELINIPDDDHVEKLEQEHEERRKAHESVFKNVKIASTENVSGSGRSNKQGIKESKQTSKAVAENGESPSEIHMEQSRTKSSLVTPGKNRSFAKQLIASDENEAYKIVKEHIAYETSGGPPKLTKSTTRKPGSNARSSTSAMLRSDAAGKALLKYSDSHKKLQSVVDSFTEKIDVSGKRRPGPTTKSEDSQASDEELNNNNTLQKLPPSLPLTSVVSESTVMNRRRNASEASTTLRQSMKTIDRASSVAQRLGTLMSRVALRNEAYDYEKQQQAKETLEKSTSLRIMPENAAIPSSQSIREQSSPFELRHQPNPYDMNANEIDSPNVPPGVSKLDSTQFGKYVEEMKKVAEKAAASFEKFKVRQGKNDADITSNSEDEETSEPGYSSKGSGEAAAIAAAAAEIAEIQEQEKNRKAILERVGKVQQRRKISQKNTPRKPANMSDAGTSPRNSETSELFTQINRNFGSGEINNNTKSAEFKFVPDMSYTDQLMLQKLRRLKEKEGWQDSLLTQQIEAENEMIVGDIPDQADMESIIKRSTNMDLPREAEKASMGPISLNAILRSRLSNNKM